jgi:hypothetical protein
MNRARLPELTILMGLCLLGLTPKADAIDFSSTKVVSLYESILDTDVSTLTRIFAETGTEVVFRGFFKWGKVNPSAYSRLTTTIAEIKARLPWIHVMGAITCAALVDGDYWPNGTVLSSDERRQMTWILPNGTTPRHYADPLKSDVLDVSKPLARHFILEYAFKFIDIGFDSLWFDEISYIPGWSWVRYEVRVSSEPYIAAWKQITTSVKEYAKSRYGKELLVSLNNGWLRAVGESLPRDPWPYQDFISVGVSIKTTETELVQDNFAGYKAQIRKVYGYLPPTMVFLDWGKPPTPLSLFGNMPREKQTSMLRSLHEACLREALMFVFPLHGGGISDYLSPPYTYVVYDAVKQGTYETIRQLTNSLVKIYLHTLTVTSTLTVRSESTITEFLPVSGMTAVIPGAMIALVATAFLAIALRARRNTHREVCSCTLSEKTPRRGRVSLQFEYA